LKQATAMGALPARDDIPTLAAAGILAYIGETMAHEALGHGGVCLLTGGHFTLLAPLFMRCSLFTPGMVLAGPGMNVTLAAASCAWLRLIAPRGALAGLLLWLVFCFNALVACGYLVVGAATGFGDWPQLAAAAGLPAAWRVVAGLFAVAAYIICLRMAAGMFRQLAGSHGAGARLVRRSMFPAAGAFVVAALAEILGGRAQFMPLALCFGCTLGIGASLATQKDVLDRSTPADRDLGAIQPSPALIVLAVIVAVIFVGVIGPGWHLAVEANG